MHIRQFTTSYPLQVYQYGGYPPQFNPAFQPTAGGQQLPPAQSTPPTSGRTGPTPQVVISDEDVKVRECILITYSDLFDKIVTLPFHLIRS